MILFPPAKINLGLNVQFKREDAYHELETCMVTVPVVDVLEILQAEQFSFQQSGLAIPGDLGENLCVRAYHLMVENFSIPPVYIHLRKEIPMGAGLGGGSSDAAYVLKGIKTLFDLDCSIEQLESLAAQLGSDCPFFIKNEAQIGKGRGELLSPCNVNLSGYFIKIVNPGIHISTKEAYAGIVFGQHEKSIKEIVEGSIDKWKTELKNDFETQLFVVHPQLASIKERLYAEGAVYAAMSGSGSTLFGIFKTEPNLSFLDKPEYLELVKKF